MKHTWVTVERPSGYIQQTCETCGAERFGLYEWSVNGPDRNRGVGWSVIMLKGRKAQFCSPEVSHE